MEFKYHDGQNQRTPSATLHPLSSVAYMNSDIYGCSLQGSEFAPSSFPSNALAPRVFPMTIPIDDEEAFQRELEKERIRRELEKDEIRREIIAGEMAMAQRRKLEEEVRREMEAKRTVEIPMQRKEGFLFQERVSVNSRYLNENQRSNNLVNNISIFGGPQSQLPGQVNIRQPYKPTNTNKDKEIILAKPDANHYGAKRKSFTPLAIDDNLEKKPKIQWSCGLCQISTTSEKMLNDHLQGKKHKAKDASLGNQKIDKGKNASLSLKKRKKRVRFSDVVVTISY